METVSTSDSFFLPSSESFLVVLLWIQKNKITTFLNAVGREQIEMLAVKVRSHTNR